MFGIFRKRPPMGSTDWAAQQFLGMLDREEREKAERQRLRQAGWQPAEPPMPADTDEPGFGDGRDAVADLVQQDIDYNKALQEEARWRAMQSPGLQVASTGIRPTVVNSALQLAQANAQTSSTQQGPAYEPADQSRNVTKADREQFRRALDSAGDMTPAMKQILDEVFDFEGGYKADPSNGAATGITKTILGTYLNDSTARNRDAYRAEGRQTPLYHAPSNLTDPERMYFMKWYADTQMGKLDIDEIAAPNSLGAVGDPKLAGQLFDVIYHYGTPDGALPIQQGINATLGEYRRALVRSGIDTGAAEAMTPFLPIASDPRKRFLGPRTRAAIRALLDAGYGSLLRANIDTEVGNLPNATGPNEVYRRGKFK